MKIAIVHDFLVKLGGAERVLKKLSDMFPGAPIFTLLYDEAKVGSVFPANQVKGSFLMKYPSFIRKRYRFLIGKMPRAIEELDFSEYDLVISSSSAFAHGVIVPSTTRHICYCHSPMRYAWDWKNEYIKENSIYGIKKLFYAPIINKIRMWDQIAADRPDEYISNSINVQERLKKYYGMESKLIYPPVDVERFSVSKSHEGYFLIVSTLSPYKKIDLAVELFNKIKRKLVIIGEGSHRPYLERIAGKNIEFLGFKPDKAVKDYIENCRALIFPGEEDFGITPVEAMAAGKPVLAFSRGGALETVISGKTGEFFFEPTVESMEDGLARLLYNEKYYRADTIRRHAENFSSQNFETKMKRLIFQPNQLKV